MFYLRLTSSTSTKPINIRTEPSTPIITGPVFKLIFLLSPFIALSLLNVNDSLTLILPVSVFHIATDPEFLRLPTPDSILTPPPPNQ